MHWIVPPKQKLFCILTACCITGISVNAPAETAPITSSGLNTQISGPIAVDGNVQYNITGGTRAGTNLFHSFGEFGVPNHTIANFHNNSNSGLVTANILARVTGGNESQIFGTIRTIEFGSANLFLMNPAGFLFGPNATLDVGGMASFTSADYLRLSDGKHGGYFYADPAKPSLLTAYPVAAFGFLGSNPEAITVQGSKFRAAGISLVGGDITIESGAQLSAPNGKIQLGSTASPGEFDATSLQSIPNVDNTSFTSFGSITLAPESTVNLSGTDTVSIRAGRFVLKMNDAVLSTAKSSGETNSISLGPNSSIISSTVGTEHGADIQIDTAALKMNQAELTTETAGSQNAGSVEIHALESIHITDSFISSFSTSTAKDAGPGGHILLKAPLVEIYGGGLSSVTEGPGDAGNITVQTGVLNLSASDGTGAEINASTYGPGQGGIISIFGATGPGSRASSVTLSGVSSLLSETLDSRGDAGSVSVETVRLTLTEGSEITTASRRSSGNARNITLNATESILLSGSFVTSDTLEGSTGHGGNISITTNNLTVSQNADGKGGRISTSTQASGNAGTVTINADRVLLTEGGRFSSSSHEDSLLPPPGGAAGTVLVQGINGAGSRAKSIVISGRDASGKSSGIFTDTQGTGPGGTITVNTNHLQLYSGATITANSNGKAKAGDIKITAADGLTMQSNSEITTEVKRSNSGGSAGGGNITITTSPEAIVYIQDSKISASVADGPGGGGDIKIDPQFVVLQNSRILAQADQDTGGNITIITSVFQKDAPSVVNADSKGGGVHGTVRIQAPYAPGGGKIQPLGNRPLEATALLNQRCAATTGGQFSSFTVAGRNSLPTELGGWLSSPLALVTPGPKASTMATSSLQASRYEPMGERSLLSLRQLTPQGFLIQAFAGDTHKGCKS